MKGYDINGVITKGIKPEPGSVILSGTTFSQFEEGEYIRKLCSQFPTYIRGIGIPHDSVKCGEFKSMMIKYLGIAEFYEDSDIQIEIIKRDHPNIIIHKI
jgi:hypothetical protein